MVNEKVQPHCMVCGKPFKRTDMVYTDNMLTQIQHARCFIVSDNPITNLMVVCALRKEK